MNNRMAIHTSLSTIESKKVKSTNKQNRNKLIDTENILTIARWEGDQEMGKKGEKIKKYKLVVTEQSQG